MIWLCWLGCCWLLWCSCCVWLVIVCFEFCRWGVWGLWMFGFVSVWYCYCVYIGLGLVNVGWVLVCGYWYVCWSWCWGVVGCWRFFRRWLCCRFDCIVFWLLDDYWLVVLFGLGWCYFWMFSCVYWVCCLLWYWLLVYWFMLLSVLCRVWWCVWLVVWIVGSVGSCGCCLLFVVVVVGLFGGRYCGSVLVDCDSVGCWVIVLVVWVYFVVFCVVVFIGWVVYCVCVCCLMGVVVFWLMGYVIGSLVLYLFWSCWLVFVCWVVLLLVICVWCWLMVVSWWNCVGSICSWLIVCVVLVWRLLDSRRRLVLDWCWLFISWCGVVSVVSYWILLVLWLVVLGSLVVVSGNWCVLYWWRSWVWRLLLLILCWLGWSIVIVCVYYC